MVEGTLWFPISEPPHGSNTARLTSETATEELQASSPPNLSPRLGLYQASNLLLGAHSHLFDLVG